MSEPRILWEPGDALLATAKITGFARLAERETGRRFPDYPALYDWSTRHPEEFWALLWRELDIKASEPWTQPLRLGRRFRECRFYLGARLNYAENLMAHLAEKETAVIYRDEAGGRIELSGAELTERVAAVAAGLRDADVVAGDRVVGLVPNHPSTLVAMLAATSLGAIWSSCSPDFGLDGILDRFGQVQPKILFASDSYRYNGKEFDLRGRIQDILEHLPSIRQAVVFPYQSGASLSNMGTAKCVWLSSFQREGAPLDFLQVPFDHPAFLLFSSGTTGKPKCIVHGGGGALVQLQKDHRLHCDLGAGDRLFFYSTCGWVMWNWLTTALATGCTPVLYDGSPLPTVNPAILWTVAEEESVTVFGAGARYWASLRDQGIAPRTIADLRSLRLLLSTGSVLSPESGDYILAEVKPDTPLASITGGTEILSAFAQGVPSLPLVRGEIPCRSLGMAVSIYDEAGEPVVGQRGELVCTQPFPSMPLKFWDDRGDRRYDQAYFSKYEGVWCHGDFAELTERGGIIMHGRSDAVLNPGGVRIGTAEIYRQLEKLDEVAEGVCVGQEWQGDERIVLFVVLRDGADLSEGLQAKIRQAIRKHASPRHVPHRILAVADVPKTMSGKVAEIAVRELIHGRPVANVEALANPESLEEFKGIPSLASSGPG